MSIFSKFNRQAMRAILASLLLTVLVPNTANAFVYGSGIYPAGIDMIGNSWTLRSFSEDWIELVSVSNYITNFEAAYGYGFDVDGISATINTPCYRAWTPDFYWVEAIHGIYDLYDDEYFYDSGFLMYF